MKFTHKIQHQYGRRYYAYLLPVEFIELSQIAGVTVDKRDLKQALEYKKKGDVRGYSYGFDISEKSPLYSKLK